MTLLDAVGYVIIAVWLAAMLAAFGLFLLCIVILILDFIDRRNGREDRHKKGDR